MRIRLALATLGTAAVAVIASVPARPRRTKSRRPSSAAAPSRRPLVGPGLPERQFHLLRHHHRSTSYSPLASSDPPVSSSNSIYGWGMTCYSGCSPSSQLKTATVRVTGFTTDAYGGRAIRSTAVNGNAWKGDSGGPEFYNGRQVGVASTADGSSTQNYGSVAYNRSWIRSVSGV